MARIKKLYHRKIVFRRDCVDCLILEALTLIAEYAIDTSHPNFVEQAIDKAR
jgi:hypothetical protein